MNESEIHALRTFVCGMCGELKSTEWTEEKARAESEKKWGRPMPPSGSPEMVSTCDHCNRAIESILAAYRITATWDESADARQKLGGLEVLCIRCRRPPVLIEEYRDAVADQGIAVNMITCLAYVITEEGTYNMTSGHYACTECYIALGMPVGEKGQRWTAP